MCKTCIDRICIDIYIFIYIYIYIYIYILSKLSKIYKFATQGFTLGMTIFKQYKTFA